jgi:hypothetical protein
MFLFTDVPICLCMAHSLSTHSLPIHCLFTAYSIDSGPDLHFLFARSSYSLFYSVNSPAVYSLCIHSLFIVHFSPIHSFPIHCLFLNMVSLSAASGQTSTSLPFLCFLPCFPSFSSLCCSLPSDMCAVLCTVLCCRCSLGTAPSR